MSVFSFATPLSSSFNPPHVSRSRKKSIFFGGLEMDIFGWKRWKRGRRDRFEYLTGESGTISGLRKLEGEADLIVVFFFFFLCV